jgi:DNA-binding GntR family transcriptional regulator
LRTAGSRKRGGRSEGIMVRTDVLDRATSAAARIWQGAASSGGPAEAKTLAERAYQRIKAAILRNEFLPGQEMFPNSLSERLNVSQTPIREALARLSADGLIEYEAHKTPRVSAIREDDVREIYEVRRVVEPYCVSRLVRSVPGDSALQADLKALLALAQRILTRPLSRFNYEEYLEMDLGLDRILLQGAGNTLFGEILNLVGTRSLRVRTFAEAASKGREGEVFFTITKEHAGIVRAILDADARKARLCTQRHLKNGEKRTMKAVRERLNSNR